MERVLEILNEIRDRLDTREEKTVEEINYCVKMISSNKLYETNLEMDFGEHGEKKNKDVFLLFNQYSSQ